MKRFMVLALVAGGLAIPAVQSASAGQHLHGLGYGNYDMGSRWNNATASWHGPYYHTEWGHPVALIVPPTARMQTEYSWGVARTTMSPIRHQFGRPVPPVTRGYGRPTPPWPWDTRQFGIYSVRGPW